MDCLFVLPVFHLPDLDLACSDAGARNTKHLKAWIVLVVFTFVTCVPPLLLVGLVATHGVLVRAA